MDFSKIKIIGGPLALANEQDIQKAEVKLGTIFPAGYREYVTTLGEGRLDEFRVYAPWRLCSYLEEWRDRIRQYWFWDEGADVLTDEQVEESIVIADTMNGDEIIFHPSQPNRLYVLPRNEEMIYEIGNDLFEAINWFCRSGKLYQPFSLKSFEPFDSRLFEAPSLKLPQPAVKPRANEAITNAPPLWQPEQVLRAFFVTVGTWENEASRAMGHSHSNTDNVGPMKPWDEQIERLYELTEPFITENFDIGVVRALSGFYNKDAPRIISAKDIGDNVEVITSGNSWSEDDPRRIFLLVRYQESWLVDGLWEVTKSGRRKKIKLFF